MQEGTQNFKQKGVGLLRLTTCKQQVRLEQVQTGWLGFTRPSAVSRLPRLTAWMSAGA
jgi:hypothetical protein